MVLMALLFIGQLTYAQTGATYVVQPGDNLQAIANAYGVSVDAILWANGIIDPNRIRRGQSLEIPLAPFPAPTTHTVQPGERLSDIALRYRTTVQELTRLNSLPPGGFIQTGQTLQLPPGNTTVTHVVQRGDTLQRLAARYGTTWQDLAARNAIPNPNLIFPGQVLTVSPPVTFIDPVTGDFLPAAPMQHRQLTNGHYIVQRGDTLASIAASFGVNLFDLAEANHILNLNVIYVGQALRLP